MPSDTDAGDGIVVSGATPPVGWRDTVSPLQASEALRESEARMHALLSSLEDLVFELDEEGTYLAIWTTEHNLLVRPEEELLGRTVTEVVGEELGGRFVSAIRSVLGSGETEFVDYALDVPAGRVYFQARISPIAGVHHPGRVCLLARDVTAQRLAEQAREDAEAQLRHQAMHDALTGLPNRLYFRERLEQALWKARRSHEPHAVVMLDVDRFKEVNDSLGHGVGDLVLQHVAQRLSTVVRQDDLVARIGGDEFAMLLPSASDEDAARIAGRVASCFDESLVVDGVSLNIDVSAGFAVYPRDGTDAEALLRKADVAMYAAKKSHGVAFRYEDGLDAHQVDQLVLVGELRGALERGELVLYYQPQMSLRTGAVERVEALVRWLHPERGLIPPHDFIPTVQESGLVRSLTHYVLDLALRQCRRWLDAGRELHVAVNLAMRNLVDESFPDDVAQLLRRYRIPADMLVLELTESSVIADPFRTRAVLARLDEMGVLLSVDDFGTGFSSLTYLTKLPVDQLKIDRSFVTDMSSSFDDEAIVRSTIDLARNLRKEVVAEGVETIEVLDALRELGCDLAQGFCISRPLPPDEFDNWFEEHSRGRLD